MKITLVKLCIGMIDAGKAYNAANKQFVNGIRELAQQSTKDEVIESFLVFLSVFASQILFDQAQRSIKTQLQTFVKDDLRKFKEAKKQFDKVSEEKETALIKNAQAPRNKQHEVEEATNILTATRKCFRHIVLDYVLQINVLQSKRRSEILKSVSLLVLSNEMSFLFWLDQLVVDAAKEKRDMEQKHSTIQQKVQTHSKSGVIYLFILFPSILRWFTIQNNQLVYQKKFKDNPTVVVEDLRLCTVKHCEDIERRFCFEVVSPTKSCMMQADSEKLRQAWIKAVQNSIATAFRDKGDDSEKLDRKSSTSTGSLDSGGEPKERSLKGESALQKVLAIPGNVCCCDCGQPEPRWASINLGITLCIQCSGIHRSLGVHFSKVRSLTLDTWEPELLKLMCELGNKVINQIYEARREELGARKPQPGDPRHEVEAYIKAKYVDRRFVRRPSDEELRSKVVSLSKQEKRLSGNSEHMPPKAPPPTPKLRPGSNASGQSGQFTALNQQLASLQASGFELLVGSLVTCEFLLQNAANVNQQDAQGRGPLHHATMLGHTGQVCLFLKRGANQNATDIEEKTPLSIAVEAANADIVTLLRLAKMNEEMREAEGPYSQSGDETYQDIFQDFTHMQYDSQRP
uniref:Arf-GAP with coiled-coil, ANK repeat and PH domain-containing protein n=1 Tax=Neolamprologus brichardi TaxID=32507 RepID=A0A3Q4HYE7_NEOBR